MPVNRKSVQLMSASGTSMNKTSEKVRGDNYYGYTDGFHTLQVTYANFVGRFRIQGTLVLEPAETDWIDIVVSPTEGLYGGSTPWNGNGYVQFNADDPANNSQAYSFYGNFAWVRCKVDRAHVGDGITYDTSYGQVTRILLSA
jgi:hypothetical protein